MQDSKIKSEITLFPYSVQVRPLVLGSVAGITECFLTAWMLAKVGFFSSVAP